MSVTSTTTTSVTTTSLTSTSSTARAFFSVDSTSIIGRLVLALLITAFMLLGFRLIGKWGGIYVGVGRETRRVSILHLHVRRATGNRDRVLHLGGAVVRHSRRNGGADASGSSLRRVGAKVGLHHTTRLELGSHAATALAGGATGVRATAGLEGQSLVVVVGVAVVATAATAARGLETATVGAWPAVVSMVTMVVVVTMRGRVVADITVDRVRRAAAVVRGRAADGQAAAGHVGEVVVLQVAL